MVNTDTELEIIFYDQLEKINRSDRFEEIRSGLTSAQKSLPPKYFYDKKGSELFEKITKLPEYYPTRTEVSILEEIAPDFKTEIIDRDIIELGSGAGSKIKKLIDPLTSDERTGLNYIPFDISRTAIEDSIYYLTTEFPEMKISAVTGDFTKKLDLSFSSRPKILFFLGSTIGNFNEKESIELLKNISASISSEDRLIVGFDMVKDIDTLEKAYNDSSGVTAEFNLNMLNVINNEFGSNFNSENFEHLAFYNPKEMRIEVHLKALCDTHVTFPDYDLEIDIKKGETIHTENSQKFTPNCIRNFAEKSSLNIENIFTDKKDWFSLVEFSVS